MLYLKAKRGKITACLKLHFISSSPTPLFSFLSFVCIFVAFLAQKGVILLKTQKRKKNEKFNQEKKR